MATSASRAHTSGEPSTEYQNRSVKKSSTHVRRHQPASAEASSKLIGTKIYPEPCTEIHKTAAPVYGWDHPLSFNYPGFACGSKREPLEPGLEVGWFPMYSRTTGSNPNPNHKLGWWPTAPWGGLSACGHLEKSTTLHSLLVEPNRVC